MDIVRVIRIIEYVGPRDLVEHTIAGSVHGTRNVTPNFKIRAATLGSYPEILEEALKKEETKSNG